MDALDSRFDLYAPAIITFELKLVPKTFIGTSDWTSDRSESENLGRRISSYS